MDPTTSNSLQLLIFNACGLKQKQYELEQCLVTYGIDIAFISETFFSNHTRFSICGYTIYRTDRPTLRGGTAILIKHGINHHPVTIAGLDHIEATSINVRKNNTHVCMSAVYKPPHLPLLATELEKLMEVENQFFIAGDLNSKHSDFGCRMTNANGRILNRHATDNNYVIFAPPPLPVYQWVEGPPIYSISL